jgi:Mce-associated membrane protein
MTDRSNGWTSAPVLGAGLLALGAAAAGAVLLSTTPSGAAAAAHNEAVVNAKATAEVVGQVDTGLARVLSYRYTDPAATHAAARQVLTGDAARQYEVLFRTLQQRAGTEQLTLTAKVVAAGVETLTADHAQLLVFLDQSTTRASDGTTSASAAQLRIAAVRRGGVWRISELVPL